MGKRSIGGILGLLLLASAGWAEDPVPVFATSEWPPYEYLENETPQGLDVEILNAVFKAAGQKVGVVVYPWARCEDMARNGEVAGIFSLGKTPDRESYLRFPDQAIHISTNYFYYKRGKNYHFNQLSDLEGLTIGVTTGYAYGEAFLASKLYTLSPAKTDLVNFKRLEAGRIDLFVCDSSVAAALLKLLDAPEQITSLSQPLSAVPLYVGFSRSYPGTALYEAYLGGFQIIIKNGVYRALLNKYLK